MRAGLKTALALGAAAAAVAAAPAAASPGPPRIHQLVVFRDGSFKEKNTRAREVRVRVGRKSCVVGQGTALSALVASRVAKVALHDYGSCSKRPRDASGLFVRKLGADANRGQDGWVYKVGHRTASAGAADPSGPFGNGRLKSGTGVLWFYCHMRGSSCQRTLSFGKIDTRQPGSVSVHVRAYNDRGKGIPAAGVTVHVGSATATTDSGGVARIAASAGEHALFADGGGYVRSFKTRVDIR